MESKRKFRHDYSPLNKQVKFNLGEVATILKEEGSNIKIQVKGTPYLLPYRDFIIVTVPVN